MNLAEKEGFSVEVNGQELKGGIVPAQSNRSADAIALFRENPGQYIVSHDFTIGDDGQLTIEMTNGEVSGTEACLFLDNFTLLHHGKNRVA
ncbi:MAG: hypothetical protein K2L62_05745 [Muribaculaceae bacterium]|nr:hypothetical protein [Muribaculaceae bacterium]